MIDFETSGSRTDGATAVLPRVQRLDIGNGKGAAVVLLPRAVGSEVRASHHAHMLDVVRLPANERGFDLLGMVFAIPLIGLSMLVWMTFSVGASLGRFVSRPSIAPLLGSGESAFRAVAVRRQSRCGVPVSAWCWVHVMALITSRCCSALWRHLAAGVEAIGAISAALDTSSIVRPSLRMVTVLAGLASCVERFAGSLGRQSFGYRSHTHTLMRPA